jgi:hypothetical protein
MKQYMVALGLVSVAFVTASVQGAAKEAEPSAAWRVGRFAEKEFFPIAVWLQNPLNAPRYQAAGINLYVGLWNGPTEAQLTSLRKANMAVICHQNAVGLAHLDDPTIAGWMHGDEPDNAQSLGEGKGYGPPILPEKVVEDYKRVRAADSSRPVLLNLGQGVAWDGWHGRGVRTNHPEDYPQYIQGCDIVSFDIYPVTHSSPQVAGQLEYVARGVERLVEWTGGREGVWNCLECTRINHPTQKPTPHQVRCEVWMALIHGSQGLIYFVHEWEPRFNEAALLADAQMLDAVTRINRRIAQLASVLNGPTISGGVSVVSERRDVPIATMIKRHEDKTYVFAVAMRNEATSAEFKLEGLSGVRTVTVLDEDRTLESNDGAFADRFAPWDVHLYEIP